MSEVDIEMYLGYMDEAGDLIDKAQRKMEVARIYLADSKRCELTIRTTNDMHR